MKKIFVLLLFVGLSATIFNACKKNRDPMQNDNNTEKQYTDYEWQVYYKLQDVKQKLNSGERGLDPISLTEAEWYMETNFNVEEARTEDPVKLQRKDTTYYTLPLVGANLAEYSDINAMYNAMLSDLDSLEYVIADASLMPMYASLSLIQSTLTSADFMLITGFGSYYSGNYAPFYADDDWKFGNMLGNCDNPLPYGDSDGGQELITRLNNPFFQWAGPGSFIDPEQVYIPSEGYPDVNNQNPDTLVGYMIFYQELASDTVGPCLENEELTFYLNNLHNIIYTYDDDYLPNTTLYGKRPEGKSFIDIEIYTPNGFDNGVFWWEHRFWANYGTRVNIPIPD
ncbi:MAG: hypothetical protein KKF98_07995 [Bacteroidetes bacterium]|nr:hypothetical protein [Bacteroidota bacterium]